MSSSEASPSSSMTSCVACGKLSCAVIVAPPAPVGVAGANLDLVGLLGAAAGEGFLAELIFG
eukprot:842884-Amphidinium_carterae.1